MDGNTLTLQLGGVQVAIIAAPPPEEVAVAVKLVFVPVAQFADPAFTEAKSEEHQVKNVPEISFPRVSVIVAVMEVLLPRAGKTVLPPPLLGARVMD